MCLILVGDSIFDNARHVEKGQDVLSHAQKMLPEWDISMLAKDGATTAMVLEQLASLEAKEAHLLMSAGGNDALLNVDYLNTPISSTDEALKLFAAMVGKFEESYRRAIERCRFVASRVCVCTIYYGNFPDPTYQNKANIAIDMFNSVIIKIAMEKRVDVLDLRFTCLAPDDFSKGIEPSEKGGKKIAEALVRLLSPAGRRGINISF